MSYIPKLLHIKQSMQVLTRLDKPINYDQLQDILRSCPPSPTMRKRKGITNEAYDHLKKVNLIMQDSSKLFYWVNHPVDQEQQKLSQVDKILSQQIEKMKIRKSAKSMQKKQDTIHEPMLFDSVMREQDQSTVTLKLSPEQFEQLKKHHQLLTTILTTTNQ
jgi:hypothetical protein